MSLQEKLMHESPDTAFERFAKNFRNMGVVNRFERGRGDNVLIVVTSSDGMNLSLVREKGHHFHIVDTSVLDDGDDPEIRHVFRYLGGD